MCQWCECHHLTLVIHSFPSQASFERSLTLKDREDNGNDGSVKNSKIHKIGDGKEQCMDWNHLKQKKGVA